MNSIHFIVTGGTIDSLWDGSRDTVTVAQHSILPEYFSKLQRNLKLPYELEFTEVCMKDSREITDTDRAKMIEEIEKSNSNKIIVTHGTYTMPDTSRFINSHLKRKDQTIILTGSMVPIEGFDFSDGPFNLGFAISEIQKLPAGVYVCMNSQTFNPKDVAKNIAEGKFYSTSQEKQ